MAAPLPQITIVVYSERVHAGRLYLFHPDIIWNFGRPPIPCSIRVSSADHVVVTTQAESLFSRLAFFCFGSEHPNVVIEIASPDFFSMVAFSFIYHSELVREITIIFCICPDTFINGSVQCGARSIDLTGIGTDDAKVLSSVTADNLIRLRNWIYVRDIFKFINAVVELDSTSYCIPLVLTAEK